MSWDLGDVVPLRVEILDAAGQPANAGQVMLTISLPDGTTSTVGPVAPTSTGVYDHDYSTIMAGLHRVRWVATGANASSYSDVLDVQPAEGAAFISLTDAKDHLKKNQVLTVDDEKLRGFIGSACALIRDRMGEVSPVTVTADRSGRRGRLVLPTRPVISITSVARLPGLASIPQADAAAGTQGWTLANSEGVMTVTGWTGQVRVTYRAGRSPLPQNFRLAALELITHLWRGSQTNQAGGRAALGEGDVLTAGAQAFALPYRVAELLGLKKNQERDEPLVL